MKLIEIDSVKIGQGQQPYVIAELSANHNGDINRAFRTIEAAKRSGANAIKLQTYTPDTITIDCDKEEFQIEGGLWDGQSLYQLYKKAYMPWEWHKPLFDKAKELGITIFSSPFDNTAVDFLEELNVPAYKIASFEAIDLPLVSYVASTGKPLIISTGMANDEEILQAIDAARSGGCKELVMLHCVSGYPSAPEDYNLATLQDMQTRFNVLVGLSDHTISNATSIASVALGACVIEKHVTLDRSGGGVDESFSIVPNELEQLCKDAKTAWQSLGKVTYECKKIEADNIRFRRSLYIVENVKKGEKLTEYNVRSIRPGYGLSPSLYSSVIGRHATQDLERGTALKLSHFE